MKISILTVTVCLALTVAARAGTISGTVRAEGKNVPESPASGGQYDSRKYKFVERVDYAQLRNFVVHLEGVITNASVTTNAGTNAMARVDTKRIKQEKANFSPSVMPIVVGTTVEWPNNDEIYHNVFSMSEAKSFDLDLYKGNPPDKRVTFDKVGRVEVFCSIHANMHCTVLVLENPYYAVADERGRYTITNVPAGTYRLKAWHERLPSQSQEITVLAEGDVTANFTLGIKNLPKH